jgi:hypothetical protein
MTIPDIRCFKNERFGFCYCIESKVLNNELNIIQSRKRLRHGTSLVVVSVVSAGVIVVLFDLCTTNTNTNNKRHYFGSSSNNKLGRRGLSIL